MESNVKANVNSDHFPVQFIVQTKLKKPAEVLSRFSKTYNFTDKWGSKHFNDQIERKWENNLTTVIVFYLLISFLSHYIHNPDAHLLHSKFYKLENFLAQEYFHRK